MIVLIVLSLLGTAAGITVQVALSGGALPTIGAVAGMFVAALVTSGALLLLRDGHNSY
jgi:hypothetical protein